MNNQNAIHLPIARTIIFFLGVILANHANADGVFNTSARVCQGTAGGAWSVASVGSIATPPTFPITKASFDGAAYAANIGLKFCPPVITAPPAVQKNPDPTTDGHACYATFHQGKTADNYDNYYGAASRRWKQDSDWGDFGKPYVYDFNTSAYVRMVDPAKRMDVDNIFQTGDFRYIPDSYAEGDIQLPIGYNKVQWRADASISSADISLPIIFVLVLPAGNEDLEKPVVKSAPKVEEGATNLVEELVQGNANQSKTVSRLFPKWLTENLLDAAI